MCMSLRTPNELCLAQTIRLSAHSDLRKSGYSVTGGLRRSGIPTVGPSGPERLLRLVPSRFAWFRR